MVLPFHRFFFSILYPDDPDVFAGAFDRALKEGIGYELEFRIIKIGGEVRTCIIQVEPLVNTAGDVSKLTGVLQDITKKIEFNHLFQQRDKQMTNLIQTVDATVWSFDVKKNKNLLSSDAVYKIFGFPPKKSPVSAFNWRRYLHPEDRKNFDHNLDATFIKEHSNYKSCP